VAVLAAVAWVVLLTGHGGFWRTDQRLPTASHASHSSREPARWPAVVAVVPARDEAGILPAALPGLLAQDYPGPFTVTLVDDGSSDGTGELAARLGDAAGRPVRVVRAAPRPPGWAGKLWAMAQGLDALRADSALGSGSGSGLGSEAVPEAVPGAAQPSAGYVLFTDADIAWRPGALRALVASAEADDRDLVSQMALLRTETGWERAIIPAFVYFFAQLYPFRRVNRPHGRTAAAAGGCMLVRRRALEEAGGLAPIRGSLIDDVALGRLLKQPPARGRTWLGLTTDVESVRPYRGLTDLWNMVARSAYTQLRYSPFLLAGTIIGLAWLYVVPPVSAIAGLAGLAGLGALAGGAGPVLCAAAGLAGWAVMTATFVPMLRLYRLSPLRAPALPVIAVMYAAMTADSARRHYAGRGGAWKGRTGGPDGAQPAPEREAARK
jgi:hopene-associated glycosyltransferase HpnB